RQHQQRAQSGDGGHAPPLGGGREGSPSGQGQGQGPPSHREGGQAVGGEEDRNGGRGGGDAGTDGVELEGSHGEAGDQEHEGGFGRHGQAQEAGPIAGLVEGDRNGGGLFFAIDLGRGEGGEDAVGPSHRDRHPVQVLDQLADGRRGVVDQPRDRLIHHHSLGKEDGGN